MRINVSALDRQRAIYGAGMAGRRPPIPFCADDLRERAKKKMSAEAWAYIDGGAGNEETIGANTAAFAHWRIRPRIMRANDKADFSCSIAKTALPFPVLLAPVGALDLVCTRADQIVARACADTGVPLIFSNQAGTPMEKCAAEMGETPRWFQLYWSRNDDLVRSFIRRAETCGCEAIVLTLDTTLLGWRTRDLSMGYLPFLRGLGIAQYTSDPVFRELLRNGAGRPREGAPRPRINVATIGNLLRLKARYPGGFWRNLAKPEPLQAVRLFTEIYSNPSLGWDRLAWLREQTRLPLFLKGILRADDAKTAATLGVSGIIVSNHGGRQVDGAIAALDALREIRQSLPRPFPVLLDSGVRSGSDIFKAIALGADAVLVGRPYAYGLAIGRRSGVRDVVTNLLNDFELTARLAGCRSIDEITTDMVARFNNSY
ncbi:MAG TPA: alpha-hydroxy-acid oxidizing protein [Puia sp.]|nr:alpha-hydroxy-acid oxidizing protein [Puia sp.]